MPVSTFIIIAFSVEGNLNSGLLLHSLWVVTAKTSEYTFDLGTKWEGVEMSDCLFCKIASGDIKGDIVFESDDLVAFRDISPQAPTHILIIPRKHIPTLNDIEVSDAAILAQVPLAVKQLAGEMGFAESGYRLVTNCNSDGGQTVFHIHYHLLAGRSLGWPPG